MDVSRRFFLKGALSVAAVCVAAPYTATAATPVLHGDGLRDDTAALQALFRGQPVIVEGELVTHAGSELIRLDGGRYLISDTVYLERDNIRVSNVEILGSEDFSGDCMFALKEPRDGCAVTHCIFRAGGRNDAAWRLASVPRIRFENA